MAVELEIVGLSDRGLVRENNEDAILVADLDLGKVLSSESLHEVRGERGALMVVCDGMGGSAGGEVASEMACNAVWNALRESPPADNRMVLARYLRRGVRLANLGIAKAAKKDPSLAGMGTTVSAAAIIGSTLVVAQVGDSRVYVQRGKTLSQVTRDQSVVSAMVNAGQLSKERAAYSMQRGRILQAVGTMPDVDVSLSIAELCHGDRILLCSDGLHDAVGHEAMAHAVAGDVDPRSLASTLLGLAHRGGGPDNISLILADVVGGQSPSEEDEALAFAELDPNREGEDAITSTSMVGRRLAHLAGIRKEPGPPRLPQTAQHPAIREGMGPAERALSSKSRISLGAALALVVGAGIAIGWMLL